MATHEYMVVDGLPFLRWVRIQALQGVDSAARRILTRFLPVNGWSWRLRVETEVADDTSATAAAPMTDIRTEHADVADFGRTWTLVVPWRPDPLRPSEAFGALIHYGILALVSDVPPTSGLGPALHQSNVSSSNTPALPYDFKERGDVLDTHNTAH
ncbi:hypothetical protein BDP81DRAFT_406745 [Colletotrichum phormii]|uniref:Uncharacterized protein n=1 Tax=Colletotrichum phormii TaxID=359342 RepID=A0AAI9ZPX7_9PEZI|nr:uncharacterized protein BDP81DRAFT_406745 [Colletotrichum phormii]KAK1635938.1 hypothetical protein BDP81DRAFT_406745 [Colletotrichum phormii]